LLNITSAKITGNPDASGWVQIHDYQPQESDQLKVRGHLFAVIATGRTEQGIDRVVAGREVLSRLHEEYFGNLEASAFNCLKAAVEKISNEYKNSWGEIEISAVAFVNNAVYTVVSGGAQAAILRNGMYAKILDSSKKSDVPVAASGFPQESDLFIFGSFNFFNSFSEGVLKAALESGETALAAESLTPLIQAKHDSGNMGAVILKFQTESKSPPADGHDLFVPPPTTAVKNVIGGKIITGIKSTFWNLISKKLPKRSVYVSPNRFEEKSGNKNREVTMTVAAILGILLIVSIIFGIRQKNINDNRSKYQARLDDAIKNYQQSLSVVNVDPAQARDLFTQSRDVADELKNEKVKDDKLTQLFSDLAAHQGQVLGEYPTNPKVFQDLSIQTSGFSGTDLTSSGDIMFILDRNSKKIIEVEIATKNTQMAAGPDQIDEALGLASYEDRVFISNSTGVYELGESKKQVIVKDWPGEVLPYAYAGNIYLLDKAGGTIWRYIGSDTGFAAKQNWLASGVEPDFSNVIAWTIDGNIFALTSSSKILKFSQGTPQDFPIPEEVSLNGANMIYTNGDLQYFYILNPQEKKIYVLNKNGDYKGDYQSDLLAGANGLVVSEKEKKMIFLSGSKLYSIDIAHL
jgi:hypothetical protein